MNLFQTTDQDKQATILAKHLPQGKVWGNAFNRDSNLGKLIRGLAVEFYRLSLLVGEIKTELDINKTSQLILDWEKSVGIPDECFSNTGNIEQRRANVLQKFSNFGGVQSVADFIRVAAFYGFDIKITPPGGVVGSFPLTFPVTFFDSMRSATHTIFVEILNYEDSDIGFPLEFPLQFSDGGTSFLKCIFEVLAPANVQVVFVPEGTV